MGLIWLTGAEHPADQHIAIDIVRPTFAQRAQQREQDRPARQRLPIPARVQTMATGIDDDRPGCEQHLYFFQPQRLFVACAQGAGGSELQCRARAFHFGLQAGNAGAKGGGFGQSQVCTRAGGIQHAQGEFRLD